MDYTVVAAGGDNVRVSAENWLVAFGKARGFFGGDPDGVGDWRVSGAAGLIEVRNGDDELLWTVKRVAPEITIKIIGMQEEDFPMEHKTIGGDGRTYRSIPPMITMPKSSLAKQEPVFDQAALGEHLFALSGDIAGKEAGEACHIALGHIRQFVRFSDALIVRGSIDDQKFEVFQGQGEFGETLVGHTSDFGVGVVGQVHQQNVTVWVNQPEPDRMGHLPERVFPVVESILAVPIVTDTGWFWGVVHLMNVYPEPDDGAIEAATGIARTLAVALRG